VALCGQVLEQLVVASHRHGRMGLGRRTEVLLNAPMHRRSPIDEPATRALQQLGRLVDSRNAQGALVEGLRDGLEAGGHGQLHVIETEDQLAHRSPSHLASQGFSM
jgi:hypothetical protein